jgi:predicted nucleotidyltransferase
MHDPLEGVTSLGTIETGASRDRVPALFEPVLGAAIVAVRAGDADSSLYVYGSVATGTAQPAKSDVDLLTVGLPPAEAADVGRVLSVRFSDLCRAVEVAAAQRSDFSGETDEAYGGRVFLRHYCVHLAGPDLHTAMPDFAADARAARGFNGDIAQHARRWRTELHGGCDPVELSRRLARKSLLAVAGLVSMHDDTWTTDRTTAAARWAEIEPSLANDLRMLLAWSRDGATPDRESVEAALDGVVTRITASFETSIGLWK